MTLIHVYTHTAGNIQCRHTHLDTSCMPLGRKIAFRTEEVCPSKVLTQLKFPTAHSFTVPSADAVATHCQLEQPHINT